VLRVDLPEATRLAQTVTPGWPEILGFRQTRIANAGTEGTNRLIKDAAPTAFGFLYLDNQRRRVRFHCDRRSRRSTGAPAALPPQPRAANGVPPGVL
jgi:transposase